MARKVTVEIIGDASSAKRAFRQMDKSSQTLGGRFGGLAKTAGLAAGSAGIGALVTALHIGIDEFTEHAKVAAQTKAVLKSTGGAAGVTAKHIEDLAEKLMKKSGVDDEAIQSGENLLASFTNIRNETGKGNKIFDKATEAMLDMSTAMGQDTRTSALQLGKALNDPIKGMSSLQRVGVTFTDAQKDLIKKLVESGDKMGAQKVILKELTKEFGGSAEAAGKTLPGQLNIAKQEFSNLAGGIVKEVLPAIKGFADLITGLKDMDIGKLLEGFKTVFLMALKVLIPPLIFWDQIETAFEWVGKKITGAAKTVAKWGTDVAGWIKDAFLKAIDFAAWILSKIGEAVMKGATTVAKWATDIVEWLKTAFLTAVKFGAWILERIGAAVMSGATTVAGWADTIGGWLKTAFLAFLHFGAWIFTRIGEAVLSGAGTVAGWGKDIGTWLKDAFVKFLDFAAWIGGKIAAIGSKIGGAIGTAAETVKGWGSALGGWIESGFKSVLDFGGWLADKIKGGANAVWTALKDLKDKIKGWLQKLFDWFSPSGMFEELGADMMRGLAKGILEKFSDPRQAIKWAFRMVGKAVPDDFEKWLKEVAGVSLGLSSPASAIETADWVKKLLGGGVSAQTAVNKAMPDAWGKEKAVAVAAMGIASQNYPYAVGGGRPGPGPSYGPPSWSRLGDPPVLGYDCSGAVSAIMRAGGYMDHTEASGYYQGWGKAGPGRYISTIAYGGSGGTGHVYSIINPFGNWGTGANASGGAGWGGSNNPGSLRHPFGSQDPNSPAADMRFKGTGSPGGRSGFGPDAFNGDYFATAARQLGANVGAMGNSLVVGPNAGNLFRGFAGGTGFAPGGLAWVGERGPELMYVPRGSQITPNHALGGGAGMLVHTVVKLDEKVLVDAVQSGLVEKQRRNGAIF